MHLGYISLYRKLLDNPRIKDPDWLAVWIYLLLNATHAEYDVVWNGERITLRPGQLITGRHEISKKMGVNGSKVYRLLKRLESEQQIEQQTCNVNSLISITNWKEYQFTEQHSEQQVNNGRTTGEHPVNTNNNVKNNNNGNKDTPIPPKKTVRKNFTKPDTSETLILSREMNVPDQVCYDCYEYYESNGWRVGRNPMKDWKAAFRRWFRKYKEDNGMNRTQTTTDYSKGF